jgi:hypothetical protein
MQTPVLPKKQKSKFFMRPPSWKYPTEKRSWQSGSSDRQPAWQVWGPEFKPQYHQKKKERGILSQNWDRAFRGLFSCPHFCLLSNNPCFLFLNTLLSSFVNWHWGKGTSFSVTPPLLLFHILLFLLGEYKGSLLKVREEKYKGRHGEAQMEAGSQELYFVFETGCC